MRLTSGLPLLLGSLAACAPVARAPRLTPSEFAALEAERARDPDDADLLLRLGAGYYRAGRYPEARDALAAGVARVPSFAGLVYLGLSLEGLNQPDSALAVYTRAQGFAGTGAERRELETRLVAVTRLRLAARARDAIARERELAVTPPRPNAVAVLPWSYLGQNDALRPLERGIAHLLVTDLTNVRSLVLLEREQVQALLDEMRLSTANRTDPRTAVRSGRMLGAARVIQGSLREVTGRRQIRLDASAVSTTAGTVAATGTATDELSDLFAMEKTVVFQLIERLGITLSPAERRAISERPTADLQAFLAFSRGLESEDRGDLTAAAAEYNAAAARDPAFRAARDRAVQVAGLAGALRQTPADLARLVAARLPSIRPSERGRLQSLRQAIQIIAPSSGGRLVERLLARSPHLKSRLSETLRQDDPAAIAIFGRLIIVIPRP